jgi:hypothetical protein
MCLPGRFYRWMNRPGHRHDECDARATEQHCANCHAKEMLGYRQSAMAHSLSEATAQPDGSFEHAFSKTRFSIRSSSSGVIQRFERGGASSEQKIAFVIGSGVHAYGYLVEAGDHLFQSPFLITRIDTNGMSPPVMKNREIRTLPGRLRWSACCAMRGGLNRFPTH